MRRRRLIGYERRVAHGGAGDHSGEVPVDLVDAEQLLDEAAQRGGVLLVRPHQGQLRTRVEQDPLGDGMPLVVVGVEQFLRTPPSDPARQLPAQVDRVLQAGVQSLAADREVHMRRVTGQQHAAAAVSLRLPAGVTEPGQPRHRFGQLQRRAPHTLDRGVELLQGHRSLVRRAPASVLDGDHPPRGAGVSGTEGLPVSSLPGVGGVGLSGQGGRPGRWCRCHCGRCRPYRCHPEPGRRARWRPVPLPPLPERQ
jgi:hypothetical protein